MEFFMKYHSLLFLFLFLLNLQLFSEEEIPMGKPALTIWTRSFGNKNAQTIVPYLKKIESELSTQFDIQFLVATKPNDPVIQALAKAKWEHPLTIVEANLDAISQGLNKLVEATSEDATVLTLSQGV